MSCNHKNRMKIAHGGWYRKKPSIIEKDEIIIHQCPNCKSIKIDSKNEYSYQEGKWSNYGV